jgi:hypothetical protein
MTGLAGVGLSALAHRGEGQRQALASFLDAQ